MRRKFGRNDLIFIGSLCLVCLVIWSGARTLFREQGTAVIITRDGEFYGKYDLAEDRTVEIENTNHQVTNILMIKQGEAKMTEADCPDKLCVHQKAVSVEKENIVCLPNRIVVTVVGEKDKGLDGFAQ